MFKLRKDLTGNFYIKNDYLNPIIIKSIEKIVSTCVYNNIDYKMKIGVLPLITECDNESYILIEFYGNDIEKIQKYVKYLNKRIVELCY